MKDYLACLSIVRFSYFPTLQTELFCWAKLFFFATQGRFMGLQHSLGTIIAAVIGKAVVDLKLEVKWELVLTHYHCHGRGSITRSDDLIVNALPLY